MNCSEMREILHAYVDTELDVVRQLACEQHLAGCPACRTEVETIQALRKTLRTPALYHQPPARLQARLKAAIQEEEREERRAVRKVSFLPVWRVLAAAAVCVFALLAFIWLPNLRPGASQEERLAQEVLGDHLRSLMVNHLSDVTSTDQHTVKPWFNGKLDFSPPVEDLAAEGFPLTGGRLEYLADRPVAALIYRRKKHYINLFLWPSAGMSTQNSSEEPKLLTRRGYHLLYWSSEGMNYWAVSDLNAREMRQFIVLLQNRIGGKVGP